MNVYHVNTSRNGSRDIIGVKSVIRVLIQGYLNLAKFMKKGYENI
jgi:hypothetical protein